jgi:glucokinase
MPETAKSKSASTILVGDIGGTNCRLACMDYPAATLEAERYQLTDDFPGPAAAIRAYLAECSTTRSFAGAVLAVAGPVSGETINLTNASWRFTRADIASAAAVESVLVVNDLAAIARATVTLRSESFVTIGDAPGTSDFSAVSVFAPGTGLGIASVSRHRDQFKVTPTEGGHIGFSPVDEVEVEILRLIYVACGHVTNELILSGPGIVRLYRALAAIRGSHAEPLAGKDIVERGVANTDALCRETVVRFVKILGSVCADTVLIQGTSSLIMAGSIITSLIPVLNDGGFRARFEARGPRTGYLQNVPTLVAPRTDLGLIGAGLLFADAYLQG